MKPLVTRAHRFAIALLAALVVAGAMAPAALADTSTSTGIAFEIVDEGRLDIAWAPGGAAFSADGDMPALSATSPPIEVTADFPLVIADTRANGNRTGYAITVHASTFTASGSTTVIPPDQLRVHAVTAEPAAVPIASVTGATLDQPVTVLAVPGGAPPVDAIITITVAMTLAPGIAAASYAGSLTFDVLPLSSGG